MNGGVQQGTEDKNDAGLNCTSIMRSHNTIALFLNLFIFSHQEILCQLKLTHRRLHLTPATHFYPSCESKGHQVSPTTRRETADETQRGLLHLKKVLIISSSLFKLCHCYWNKPVYNFFVLQGYFLSLSTPIEQIQRSVALTEGGIRLIDELSLNRLLSSGVSVCQVSENRRKEPLKDQVASRRGGGWLSRRVHPLRCSLPAL